MSPTTRCSMPPPTVPGATALGISGNGCIAREATRLPESIAGRTSGSRGRVIAGNRQARGETSHENYHWIQFNATTVGAFLQYVSYCQQAHCNSVLMEMPRKKRVALIKARDADGGQVLVDVADPDLLARPSGDNDLDQLRRVFYSHQIVRRLFDFLSPSRQLAMHLEDALRVTVYEMLHIAAQQRLCDPWDQELLKALHRHSERQLSLVRVTENDFATRDILEGAATANEFLLLVDDNTAFDLLGLDAWKGLVTDGLSRMLKGDYGIALRAFLWREGGLRRLTRPDSSTT